MRILIVSDVWRRQTSGVVTTLINLTARLTRRGHVVSVMHPGRYPQVPTPMYREIPMAWPLKGTMARKMRVFRPDAIHIMSEHSFCLAVRNWCLRNRVPFTTSFATRIPEYVEARTRIPAVIVWRYLRWFHSGAVRVTASLPSLKEELEGRGFRNVVIWSRGVDTDVFRPLEEPVPGAPPVFSYLGRVAREKRIDDFLRLELPGRKVIIGDGPDRLALQTAYPQAEFTGYLKGDALVRKLSASNVFVFPSKTDTFGLVVLEANACGVPVACYPVSGPGELVRPGVNGYLAHESLQLAAVRCMLLDRVACRIEAMRYSWDTSVDQFLGMLAPISAAS
jgi:glycosyltransferase involved in cell wall biosynthesis